MRGCSVSDEVAQVRREFNDRFGQFEKRIEPFIERSTVALEKIAATERAVAEHAIRTDRTFDRVFDAMDNFQHDTALEHKALRDKDAELESMIAVERPQNARIRDWIDRVVFGAALVLCYMVGKAQGWL